MIPESSIVLHARSITTGLGASDAVIKHLGACLLPALDNPGTASQLFVDHLSRALEAHIQFKYGASEKRPLQRGGLAPWQQRCAQQLLSDHLDGSLSVREIARRCELSLGHFARAFKQSTGWPPHRWLMEMRIEKSKKLLSEGKVSIAEVAIAGGFSDQSHFTRIFSRGTGMTPGAWRRAYRTLEGEGARRTGADLHTRKRQSTIEKSKHPQQRLK